MLFPLRLAGTRVKARAGRAALVGIGLAAAAATLAAVLAASLVAQDRSVGRAIDEIPEQSRALRAVWFGVPDQAFNNFEDLDRVARRSLEGVTGEKPVRALLYRRSGIRGRLVDLGAVDGLGRWVELVSGRLPEACRPERCEVLHLGGEGPVAQLRDISLTVVGEARLRSDVLLGEFVEPGAYHQPATPPFLLAEGVDALAKAPELATIYRSYAWVVPLQAGSVRAWETDEFAARVTRARSELQVEELSFDVDAPVATVVEAGETSRAAGRRLLLIGGQACALLLAFALLAATAVRRDGQAARRRLTWFGARRWQVELLSGTEAVVIAVTATVLGWLGGAAISALVASEAGVPVGTVLSQSVVSWTGGAAAAALAGIAALVLFLTVRAGPVRLRGLSVSPVDMAAVGAVVAILLILARGSTDADALAREGGTGVALLLLPGLVAFATAVLCARALVPGLRALELFVRGRSVPLRLAALSLARNPGYAAIAIAFLSVSLGLALFAETYRSTLARGQEDQAAYEVPADLVAKEDLRELVRPLEAAPLERYEELGEPAPVIRLSGSLSRLDDSDAVTVLGLDSQEVASLEGWRSDFASESRGELAGAIESDGEGALAGPELPADAQSLRLVGELSGHPVAVTASVAGADGSFVSIVLGRVRAAGPVSLQAAVPAEARGGRLVALTFSPPARIEEPGGAQGRAAQGVLAVDRLEALGAGSTRFSFDGWIPTSAGFSAVEIGDRTEFHYSLTNQVVSRFRPRQPTDDARVPVLATPQAVAAAGPDGVLPIEIGSQRIVLRITGRVERFPTVDGEALVADRELLATALNADQPGSALPSEVWIDVRPDSDPAAVARMLARAPFDVLEVTTREETLERLRGDPLARAALLTLLAGALLALGLALVGILLGVVTDLSDQAGVYYDLEAQGAAPGDLRLQVRLRALLVDAIGVAGGVITGVLLSLVVVDLVRLTANAAAPQPPLATAVSWPVVVLAVVAYIVLAAALVGLSTARAFRSSGVPTRVSEQGA